MRRSRRLVAFRGPSHEAKLGNHVIERRLTVVATARNARTIAQIVALEESLARGGEPG